MPTTIPDTPEPSSGRSGLYIPLQLPGLRAASGLWNAFILDLWGVIHDGVAAYPHSAETLRQLRATGARVMFLSNAPRRASALIAQMETMGIPRDLYDDILSSGDAVHHALLTRKDPAFAALGNACFHLGPERDLTIYEETGVVLTDLDHATFIMNTGPVSLDDNADHYRAILAKGVQAGLPMVCANPDRTVIQQGKAIVCAGALADIYIEYGGTVIWRGKPDPAVYRLCLEKMGFPSTGVCTIGDSLETDMAGAAAASIDGLWVTGGIHADEVGGAYGKPADPLRMARLAARHGVRPAAALAGFIW
ncbi:TIGR01459 family HAD-type hydrolase [Haematospirillum jordaniae]|uniref:TIGR01459 family HAD-type hydrolase n=1 Tax=Haematospirillum jordaniae TaxID=1549855 RepID=UPI002AC31B67|nr:TIGR01459 family HAD-type hydrolase [Haematospirillum jordaniae]